jgi:hypothetical protein
LDAEASGMVNFFKRIKVFRNGNRQLGIWEGEEIATRRPAYKEDTDAHEFRFHSMGAVNDALHPELDIRFDSGVRGNAKAKLKPSITDDEALEIWDRIINTIRIRKVNETSLSRICPSEDCAWHHYHIERFMQSNGDLGMSDDEKGYKQAAASI